MKKAKGLIQKALAGFLCVIIGAGITVGYWQVNVQSAAAEEVTEITSEAASAEEVTEIISEAASEETVSSDFPEISGEEGITDIVSESVMEPEDEDGISETVTEVTTEAEAFDINEELSIEVVPADNEEDMEPEEVTEDVPEEVTAVEITWSSPREFVSRLYEVFLGRPADTSGLEFWTGKLERQEMGAANVAYSIIFSSESRQNNMSDEEFCLTTFDLLYNKDMTLYSDVYMRYLQEGLSREFVVRCMTDFSEFSRICEKYGMKSGLIRNLSQPRDQYPELTRFVSRLYTEALGRPGEEDGLNYWCDGLMNKGFSTYTVANFFINSPEFKNKNLSDEEYVKTLYRTFFGREYDQEGLDFWTGRLATGTSRAYVLNFFEYSWEFFDIVTYFNIKSSAELWIDERNLILNSIADPRAKAAILYALDRKGYPYSQELRNTGAYYDCSSLVYYSWQYAGVDLRYRGSNTAASIAQGLVTSGKQIHPSTVRDLQPGDLIFSTGADNNRYMGISHVAMYMGSGRVIETPVVESIGAPSGVGRTYIDDESLNYLINEHGYIVCRP